MRSILPQVKKNTIKMCKPTIIKITEAEETLFDLFSRNAKYYKGEYYIMFNEKELVAKTPKDLFQKVKNEYNENLLRKAN